MFTAPSIAGSAAPWTDTSSPPTATPSPAPATRPHPAPDPRTPRPRPTGGGAPTATPGMLPPGSWGFGTPPPVLRPTPGHWGDPPPPSTTNTTFNPCPGMAASRIHSPPPCPRDLRHLSVTIDTHQCLKMSPPLLTGASGPYDGETQKIWVPQNIFQLMTHSSSQSICYWHPIIIPMFLAHFSVIHYLVFYICDFDELRIVKKNLYTCVFFSITYSFIIYILWYTFIQNFNF